jgi:hypothetical protein
MGVGCTFAGATVAACSVSGILAGLWVTARLRTAAGTVNFHSTVLGVDSWLFLNRGI